MWTQVFYVRSLREQCRPRLWRGSGAGDGGIPLVALQTSSVWANIVTSLVLFLSPAGGLLQRQDPGEMDSAADGYQYDMEMEDDWSDLVGVYCGVYEPCSHGEAAVIFATLVNSTGTRR